MNKPTGTPSQSAASIPFIKITTFGTLQVVRKGHTVTEGDWHTRQARQLLKILITERPRPVSSDRLIEILWPNSTPSAAATTLRSAINALRNVLEPERPNRAPSRYIITQTPGYAFRGHPDIWLDVAVFEQELDKLRTSTDPQQRRQSLSTAIALYQDDYLISDPYADWVQNERERLQERYFNATLQIAELQAQAGDYTAAITSARSILSRDEVRENAYQALMRYQAESGDSASALLTYERCRTILAEELGADPSPLTQMLHRRILNGEIQPIEAEPMTTHAPPTEAAKEQPRSEVGQYAAAAGLPQQLLMPIFDAHFADHFVGREQVARELEQKLEKALAGKGDLLVLEGEAGVGKSRLAYHVLQSAAGNHATVISASCQALEQELPFAPLADSLGRYLHGLPRESLSTLPTACLAQLAQIVPSLQDLLPDLPVPTNDGLIGADENRQRLIDGIVALMAALSRLRPLVLFFDDLHWADHDTLAVLGRLSNRVASLPLFVLLAYRSDDLAENEALITLLHAMNRTHQGYLLPVTRLRLGDVQDLVTLITGQESADSHELATFLYEATQGNALFVTEALRDFQERRADQQPPDGHSPSTFSEAAETTQTALHLAHSQQVQEVILERIERLQESACDVLHLAAVIGRDFSLELLETVATDDPISGLEILLERKFLLERPDQRLDFSHQVVRQVAYESMNNLQRRRLHLAIADALVQLQRASQNPAETAFHYGQAGGGSRRSFAHYSVLAGERLLRAYGFRQAVTQFDIALDVLDSVSSQTPDLIRRALQGRGLAYEGLLDPPGVSETYRRLQKWASDQGDRELMLTTYSRLSSILGLMGQQRESNLLLGELFDALSSSDGAAAHSSVIQDLLERRRVLYSVDPEETEAVWAGYTPPPPVVANPVDDITRALEPVHAVLPLFDYGWTLLVQGQLGEATRCLEAVVDLASETSQPSIASTAYHQLAITARVLGDLEQSQSLNERSIAINREVPGTASELASMWPRIASAFLALQAGRLDEAERRVRRVIDYLEGREGFSNYRNSANICLGLILMARGSLDSASRLLEEALADAVNLYPYTHVRALLGLARIAHLQAETSRSEQLLRSALRFSGVRSLLEEYVESLLEIARLRPADAPVVELLQAVVAYVEPIGLAATVAMLQSAMDEYERAVAPA